MKGALGTFQFVSQRALVCGPLPGCHFDLLQFDFAERRHFLTGALCEEGTLQ